MLIWLYLRHIKAYKWINFIPIWYEHNFVSYVWENGIWKSSILEALDSFFNWKKYIINKDALSDSISGANNPYILPIFLIEKSKLTRNKKEFEKISDFFWTINRKDVSAGIRWSMKDFFDLRDKILNKKETHYLILIWETNFSAWYKTSFWSFHSEENFLIHFLEKDKDDIQWKSGQDRESVIEDWVKELDKKLESANWKKLLQEIKNLYSYVYLPVELDIEKFTKIETDEMQKIFDTDLKKTISGALSSVKFLGTDWINTKLDIFVENIKNILEWEYEYDTWAQRWNTVTVNDIVDKIIEAYFQKRILYKGNKKVSNLSAWEKRQALISLVYAFLLKSKWRNKNIIIAIDEPENSLHTSLCYDQFEKLQNISEYHQILITTHWYWFLPIVNKGISHFLTCESWNNISFETYDLYDYKSRINHDISTSKNEIPHNFILKSTTDLVHSIFYSLSKDKPYNWLIVEWISEKIYFEYFFKDEILSKKLRILCLWGKNKVAELYQYLELPIKNEKANINWSVFCLIDTDNERYKEDIGDWNNYLKIRRLSNKGSEKETQLLTLSNWDTTTCDIEQALNPIIFKKTIDAINPEEKYKIKETVDENWNTSFIKNFKNIDLEDYFKINDWDNKIIFAKKYIEIMGSLGNIDNYIPKRIKEIKGYFN